MSLMMPTLKACQMSKTLSWKDGVPFSIIYDDIYFSLESGLSEATHVFINGNKLPERWAHASGDFTIIETGFGTGLNFFTAWKLWQEYNPSFKLNFISIEKHPLSVADITAAIGLWPEFAEYLTEFSRQYPQNPQGEASLGFAGGNIKLKLIFSDVNEALPKLKTKADAWFLDGFSPAKNPDMWNDLLYQSMERLTNSSGTFATFTASGEVRRGLAAHGFDVIKTAGFGKKRHILVGSFLSLRGTEA